jgi:pre-mRNA-splicing factor RBM22/SLT11
MPEDNGLQKQNIKDRYHGRNDPVAKKLLSSYATSKGLEPPVDPSIQSLFLTTLPANATEETVRTHVIHSLPFLSPEDIRSVVHVAKSRCAFVNFKSRVAAERAAEAWAAGLDMEGQVVGVKWGKSRAQKAGVSVPTASEESAPAPVPV